jgi:AmiR/NasT family two-component response regulator
MQVVEQAKGVIMANSRCSPDQAFEMLRSAAQLSNIKLSDLAGMIVRNAAGVRGRRVLLGRRD